MAALTMMSVGLTAEGHFFDNRSGLLIHNVEHILSLIANIDATPVGGEGDVMGQLDAFNLLHDLVSCRVDDIDGGPGATRVVDENPPRQQG